MDIHLTTPSSFPIITISQPIIGHLTFTNPTDRPNAIITICLVGTAETNFKNGRTLYSSTSTLCSISTILQSGPLPKNTFSWPFTFTFPTASSGETKKWLDIPPFHVKDGGPLPPSMVFDSEDFEHNRGTGAVTYKLVATLSKSEKIGILGPKEKAEKVIYHIPHRKFANPDARIATLGRESFTCVLGGADEKKSFWKRSKKAVFELKVETPHTVFVGGSLPVILKLTHEGEGERPEVKLTSVTVSVLRTVHAAGKALLSEEDGKFVNTEVIFERSNLSVSLPIDKGYDLTAEMEGGFKTRFGMSFATYNVAQTFKLMVKVEVEVRGKKFWTELRSKNVVVLSPFTREDLDKGGSDPEMLLRGMHGSVGVGSGEDAVVAAGVGVLAGVLGIVLESIL